MTANAANDEVVRCLIELLALARVAMPDYLFAIDPRVHRARQLVATRTDISANRPPSTVSRGPLEMVDLAPRPTMATIDGVPGAEPPWDITAGLDAFMASDLATASRSEAVTLILRDWLIGHGFIEQAPDDGGH